MHLAFHANSSLMRQHNMFNDCQSQSGPPGFARAGLIYAIETFKEPGKMFGSNAGSEITNVELRSMFGFVHAKKDFLPFARILQSIVNQVGKYLMDCFR